jgi:phage shock protein E
MQIIFLIGGLVLGYFLFKKFMIAPINYAALLNRGAMIIDVRTPQEYDNGHIQGSKNIPLQNIANRVQEIQSKGVPVICVCASGMRSGSACAILKKAGVECYNGGGWQLASRKMGRV